MTSVVARYYPCTVQLPGEPRPRRKAFALLARGGDMGGLHVWNRPGEVADVHLPIDWTRTATPPTSPRQARNGVAVTLTDGSLVILTPGAGCRCGALGRWAGPAWAHTVAAQS